MGIEFSTENVLDPGKFFRGPDTRAEDNARKEEERKQRLREQLNAIYGFDTGNQVVTGYTINGDPSGKSYGSFEEAWARAIKLFPEETGAGNNNAEGTSLPNGSDRITAVYGPDQAGSAARAQMAAEDKQVSDATRNYYTDQLGRAFVKAERNTRFNLARQSLLGGSEDVNQQAEVRSDRDLGATRIDEATRRAVTQLHGDREDARLKGIGLINAGAGEEGVRSASAGLKQSLDTAMTQQRADLTSDLFANAVDAYAAQNANAANQALLARYRNQLATSFPNTGSTSGRVTPTQ